MCSTQTVVSWRSIPQGIAGCARRSVVVAPQLWRRKSMVLRFCPKAMSAHGQDASRYEQRERGKQMRNGDGALGPQVRLQYITDLPLRADDVDDGQQIGPFDKAE